MSRRPDPTLESEPLAPGPGALHVHFARGERPHVFWVSPGPDPIKVLSKRRGDGSLEVLIVQDAGPKRQVLTRTEVPADAPSGWLAHWVERFAEEQGTRFQRYDLRHVESAEQWLETAAELGWLRGPRGGPGRERA
jgi:hypothetical protein